MFVEFHYKIPNTILCYSNERLGFCNVGQLHSNLTSIGPHRKLQSLYLTIVFLYQQQEEARNPQHFLYLLFYIELMIENMLLCSLLSEEEVLITYYEDGYLLSNYMTVVGIDPPNSAVICTDVFYNKMKLLFSNIIDVK